jgi:hypothetical protein
MYQFQGKKYVINVLFNVKDALIIHTKAVWNVNLDLFFKMAHAEIVVLIPEATLETDYVLYVMLLAKLAMDQAQITAYNVNNYII